VSKVVEILDVDAETQEGAAHNEHNAKKSKCAVIKTSTRQVG
jgi:26S proteasome regulatory subunit T5